MHLVFYAVVVHIYITLLRIWCENKHAINKYVSLNDTDSLLHDCSKSIANALELLQSCTKSSIWNRHSHLLMFSYLAWICVLMLSNSDSGTQNSVLIRGVCWWWKCRTVSSIPQHRDKGYRPPSGRMGACKCPGQLTWARSHHDYRYHIGRNHLKEQRSSERHRLYIDPTRKR